MRQYKQQISVNQFVSVRKQYCGHKQTADRKKIYRILVYKNSIFNSGKAEGILESQKERQGSKEKWRNLSAPKGVSMYIS